MPEEASGPLSESETSNQDPCKALHRSAYATKKQLKGAGLK